MTKRIILALLYMMLSFGSGFAKEELKWGVVFINGKAAYVDPTQLDMSALSIPDYVVDNYKSKNIKIIPKGKINWFSDNIYTMDIQVIPSYNWIFETRKTYKYKVEHNVMFLSEDGKTWEVLQMSVVDDKEKLIGDKLKYPRHMIIHLKCKWFENDYELIGTMGS